MPDAPQMVAGSNLSGLGLMYATPPSQEYNLAAAFMAGYTQQRLPAQQAVFAAQLKALDPSARYAQLAKLQATRASMLDQLAANDRNKATNATTLAKSADDLVGETIKLEGMRVGAEGQVASANIGRETELLKQRSVRGAAAESIVADMAAAVGETEAALARAAQMPPGEARNQAETAAWSTYDKRVADNSKALQSNVADPGVRDAVREAVQGQLAGIGLSDQDLAQGMKDIAGDAFQAPAKQSVTSYGVRTRGIDEIVSDADRAQAGRVGGASRSAPPGGASTVSPAPTPPAGGSPSQGGPAVGPAGSPPTPSGPPTARASGNTASNAPQGAYSSDDELRAGVSAIDDLMRRLQAEDPTAGLDEAERRLGTGINWNPGGRPGAPRAQGDRQSRAPRAGKRAKKSTKKSTEDKAAELVDYTMGPAMRDIPDPTAPVRRTVGSNVSDPPEKPATGKKPTEEKAKAFLEYGPPDIRESEPEEPDTGESEPEDRLGESDTTGDKPKPPPPSLVGIYGQNALAGEEYTARNMQARADAKAKAEARGEYEEGRSAGQRVDATGAEDDKSWNEERLERNLLDEAMKKRKTASR